MTPQIDNILKELKPKMKPERYAHTIGVMFTAANLAYAHNADAKKAMLAGALHDCGKLIGIHDYITVCKEKNIPIRECAYKSPYLLHADLGAYFAQNDYHVEDEEVLHAILVHTTGCPNMSLLDKIIFLADYIEPLRHPFDGLDHLRKVAYEDLDHAVFLECENVISYIKSRGLTMDPITRETYEYYKCKSY